MGTSLRSKGVKLLWVHSSWVSLSIWSASNHANNSQQQATTKKHKNSSSRNNNNNNNNDNDDDVSKDNNGNGTVGDNIFANPSCFGGQVKLVE